MSADPRAIPPVTVPDSVPVSEDSQTAASRANQVADGSALDPVQGHTHGSLRIWSLRLRALLFVTLCATFGVLLLILPWTPKWTDNPLLLDSTALRDFVSSGFVRGFASGLGLLDLWLGFREAILYHENPKDSGQ